MERTSREWLVPLTGLLFIALLIVSFVLIGEPKDADHPAPEISKWYLDNKDSIEFGAFITAIAGAVLIFYGAYLRKVLVAAEGPGAMLPILVVIGLAIVAVSAAIDSTLLFANAEAADDVPPSAIQAVQVIWDNDFVPFILGTLVFIWSAGLSVLRTGALPKWLGWVAIVIGVVGLAGPASFFAAPASALWIIVTSILLSMRARSVPAPAAA
jgi:hypothetical protein